MTNIEVTDADIAAVKAIESDKRTDVTSEDGLRLYLQVAFARHRLAAAADVEAKVAEAVREERVRVSCWLKFVHDQPTFAEEVMAEHHNFYVRDLQLSSPATEATNQ